MTITDKKSLIKYARYGGLCLALCSPFASANNVFDVTVTEETFNGVIVNFDADSSLLNSGSVDPTMLHVRNTTANSKIFHAVFKFTVPNTVTFEPDTPVIVKLVSENVNAKDIGYNIDVYELAPAAGIPITDTIINTLTWADFGTAGNPSQGSLITSFQPQTNKLVNEIDVSSHVTAPGEYSFLLVHRDADSSKTSYPRFDSMESTTSDSGASDVPVVVIGKTTSVDVATTKGFSVSPSTFVVNADNTNGNSSQVFTITNHGELNFQLTQHKNAGFFAYDQFTISDDGCISVTLAQGETCTFTATKNYMDDTYTSAVNDGSQDAGDLTPLTDQVGNNYSSFDNIVFKYEYDSNGTNLNYTILSIDSDFENISSQAKRRVSPLLKSLQVNENDGAEISTLPLTAATDYDIFVDVDGYNDDYDVVIALFDCSAAAIADDSCAANFGSNIVYGQAFVDATPTGAYSYQGVDSTANTYKADITVPGYADTLVARVYYRADNDKLAETNFISVIGAGGTGMSFVDGLGRKIIVQAN